MGDRSAIEWTEATWNPIRGCSRVSEGCRHCYAEAAAGRWARPGEPYFGLVERGRWTGRIELVRGALEQPLRWRRPRRIFVNSMSDLFHDQVRDEWIAAIFAIMFLAGDHTFQVLTKRPERMARWCRWLCDLPDPAGTLFDALEDVAGHMGDWPVGRAMRGPLPWPHVWLGVSVEDQATADARIPLLLGTPAAVRWVSYEPALGPVSFAKWCPIRWDAGRQVWGRELETPWVAERDGLSWLVVGGESGPGARPFDLAWARDVIAQGRAAGLPVFVKQLGALPYSHNGDWPTIYRDTDPRRYWPDYDGSAIGLAETRIVDRKGGEPAEWPEDLRVREYPAR